MKGKRLNLILSIILIFYLIVSYIISGGHQLLYGISTYVEYMYPVVIVIALYCTISYVKIAIEMFRNNHIYKAVFIFLSGIILLLLFIYQMINCLM